VPKPCCSVSTRRKRVGRSDVRRSYHLRGTHVHRRPFRAIQSLRGRELARGHDPGSWRKDKIAAGLTNSGSRSGDKLAALIQLALCAARQGMHWISLGLPPANHSSTSCEAEMNRLGFWLGAGTQSDTEQGPDVAPPEADLATARHLGRRVAQVTLQFVRGRAVVEAGWRPATQDGRSPDPSDDLSGAEICQFFDVSSAPFADLAFENPQDRYDCVPIPCRRRHTAQLVDLTKIADRLHVTTVHPKHELSVGPKHPHQPRPV